MHRETEVLFPSIWDLIEFIHVTNWTLSVEPLGETVYKGRLNVNYILWIIRSPVERFREHSGPKHNLRCETEGFQRLSLGVPYFLSSCYQVLNDILRLKVDFSVLQRQVGRGVQVDEGMEESKLF